MHTPTFLQLVVSGLLATSSVASLNLQAANRPAGLVRYAVSLAPGCHSGTRGIESSLGTMSVDPLSLCVPLGTEVLNGKLTWHFLARRELWLSWPSRRSRPPLIFR